MTNPNPVQPENPSTDMTWWKGHLNVIGLFIGTHGLAVFLVVFYTVYLHPRGEAERKEWIEQITSIRMLVEPVTRTLTISQADAVLSIAKRAFTQDLQLRLELVAQQNDLTATMNWGGGDIEFWGEMFIFEDKYVSSAPVNEQAIVTSSNDLSHNMRRFNIVFEQRLSQYRQQLYIAFDRAFANSEVLRYQLGRLRSEQGTLDEVWQLATDSLRNEWIQYTSTSTFLDEGPIYGIKAFKRKVEKHHEYRELSKTDPELFKYLHSSVIRTEASPVAKIANTLEQNLAKALKTAYTRPQNGI